MQAGLPLAQGAEKRRYPRIGRRLKVTFLLEEREVQAVTVDVSKTGASFEARYVPSVGSQLLLVLQDLRDPELRLNLKARVVRTLPPSAPEMQRFAVEFGDAVSKDVKSMGRFLKEVLNIDSGLIRVSEDRYSGERIFSFSFEPIVKEGDDRLRALQASLFRNLNEMEEADGILANWGKSGTTGQIPAMSIDPQPVETISSPTLGAIIPPPNYDKSSASKGPGLFGRITSVFAAAPRHATATGLAALPTQDLPKESVVRNSNLPVTFRIGTSVYPAQAVRMYTTGMKCETEAVLPALYSSVILLIPVASKRGGIELVGDVTRIRAKEEAYVGGTFEVRFSMRTDRAQLEAYRKLLDDLNAPH